MSIIVDKVDPTNNRYIKDSASVRKRKVDGKDKSEESTYNPTAVQRDIINSFLKDFRNSWQTMHMPRPEFNDMSLYQRYIVDMLAFNTYQENDGAPMLEDRLGGWKSNAVRPVIRNKAISIAAHMTSRLIVPKVFAYNEASDEQEDAAKVMGYLVDWAREQADYSHMALFRVLAALYSPISWGYSEYTEVYRKVHDDEGNLIDVIDEDLSGFKHIPLSTDQVYFPNFYERDCQKQDFIIIRRIISYDQFCAKYPVSEYPDAVYVKPGIVVVMDDANRGFYQVYDSHMRSEEVEEVIRWRKNARNEFEIDTRAVMVNGILLECKPNPRKDHQFPLDCFYYLPINERCIAGKSLVFALQSDATIVNTLYQLFIDGTYLNQMPPVVTTGSDKVGADVFVPGLNLAFADQDVKIQPIRTGDSSHLAATAATMEKVELSISESSQGAVQQGQEKPGTPSTAYEISRIETNAATVLGLTMKFLAGGHILPYGRLLISDVLQYMTIVDSAKITGDEGLIYKTFYTQEAGASGKQNKINFDINMPEQMTEEEKMDMSYELLLGKINPTTTIHKVNPKLFREYKYIYTIDSDVLNPRSAELIRAFDIETYDRAIANPVADQEKIFTDLLMATNPKTARDPKAYVTKAPPQPETTDTEMVNSSNPKKGQASMPKPEVRAGKLPQNV